MNLERGVQPERPPNEQRDGTSERRPVLRAVVVVELDGLAHLVMTNQVFFAA